MSQVLLASAAALLLVAPRASSLTVASAADLAMDVGGIPLELGMERLDGPDGKPLFDGSWSQQEQARLDELETKLPAQR